MTELTAIFAFFKTVKYNNAIQNYCLPRPVCKHNWVGGLGGKWEISIRTLNDIYNIKELKCSYKDILQVLNSITGLFSFHMLLKI